MGTEKYYDLIKMMKVLIGKIMYFSSFEAVRNKSDSTRDSFLHIHFDCLEFMNGKINDWTYIDQRKAAD